MGATVFVLGGILLIAWLYRSGALALFWAATSGSKKIISAGTPVTAGPGGVGA
jgi:hypothetical protein